MPKKFHIKPATNSQKIYIKKPKYPRRCHGMSAGRLKKKEKTERHKHKHISLLLKVAAKS
jgi:hypothetical protein